MNFKNKYDEYLNIIEKALDEYIEVFDIPQKNIINAMKYSINAGGKRLRPVIALAVCDMLGCDIKKVLPYACAIEMIHTYSLIHDDLPAMDNDDFRRGIPTNHKVFGEAIAILAGDALLNYAFEIMLDYLSGDGNLLTNKSLLEYMSNRVDYIAGIKAMNIIAKSSGYRGMIGGQVIDIESEGKKIDSDLLEYMHQCKTGQLLMAPVLTSALIAGASEDEFETLKDYAKNIGIAFQIKDDILDVIGDAEKLGKPIGSDVKNDKSTFTSLYGLEKSQLLLSEYANKAIDALERFGDRAWFLIELINFIKNREH